MFVYGLRDPISKEIRYVGKQGGKSSRYAQHLKPSTYMKRKGHIYSWIRKLVSEGLKPEQVVLAQCSSQDELNEAERSYIAYFRGLSVRLCNHTDGGDGTLGLRVTSETREKLRKAIIGKRVGENHPLWGRSHSLETKAKMKAKKVGFRPSESHIRSMQAKRRKPVIRNDGKIYESTVAAARDIGVHQVTMDDHVKGRAKTCRGFVFKYL